MKKKIKIFLIFFITLTSNMPFSNELDPYIQPEYQSLKSNAKLKYAKTKNFIVVTANEYATDMGYEILEKGGTVADAAVAIQLILGLVEPQSSGLGGGTFATYYHNESQQVVSYEGREKAPLKIKDTLFLNAEGQPKDFYEAAIGGASVGVPSTLKTLLEIHNDFGNLKWESIVSQVTKFSESGFNPPKRLINAINKEKFFFDLYPDSIFKKIKVYPERKFRNDEYTQTLRKISTNPDDFYEGKIASNIVNAVNTSKNPGSLSMNDLKKYKIKKNDALCHPLDKFFLCGPNLPSSGTICVLQSLKLYDLLLKKKEIYPSLDKKKQLNLILDILDFVYYLRENTLADDEFEKIDISKLLNEKYLEKEFENFQKKAVTSNLFNVEEFLNSTSHFTLTDKYNNVLSLTSSIESSFGSRLLVDGFFLNNQLTDFSFKPYDEKGRKLKNKPAAGKSPLSSMTPLIIFDENKNFHLSIGSPGGKAIISYVVKSLIDILYLESKLQTTIQSANYVKIRGKTFVEENSLNKILKNKGFVRSLTSGLAIIKKEDDYLIGVADPRRDGSVRGN